MRLLFVVTAAASLALVLGAPSPARATECSGGYSVCGPPTCPHPTLRTRPGITRRIFLDCSGVTSVRVVTPPAHSEIYGAWVDRLGLMMDVAAPDDAPRWDEAVFELEGPGGKVEQHVSIEVIPASENSPPVCDDARAQQHTWGDRPVNVWFKPNCRDPDGDDFVIEGAHGPGEHPRSPERVTAGASEPDWSYITATFEGEETTTIWATDSLGARSRDAQLTATVGPGVDAPPECTLRSPDGLRVEAIAARQGKPRRFSVLCEDPDFDPLTATVSAQPARGTISAFEPDRPYSWGGGWGTLYDVTYVPADNSLDPDPFSVTVTGSGGEPQTKRMAIVPRPPESNGGATCVQSTWKHITPNEAGPAAIHCYDEEGDPFSAEATSVPQHGTISSLVPKQLPTGEYELSTTYTPDRNYEGPDSWNVRVTDGYGSVLDLPMDVQVQRWPGSSMVHDGAAPPPPDPPPAAPPIGPDARKLSGRAVAERALGTTAVKRVRNRGGVQVWARRKLSRDDLERYGHATGLVVLCSTRCMIRADSMLAPGSRAAHGIRRRSAAAVTAAQPYVLWLTLDRSDRRALRRIRRPRWRFEMRVRPFGRRPASLKTSIPIGRGALITPLP